MLKIKYEKQNKKVLITHFAGLLKFICKQYFDWDGVKDDEGRALLQYVGTDVIRAKRPNYWVKFIKDILSMFKNKWDYVLIPDCRFPNEINWGEDWDTTSVRVERINFESPLAPAQQNHPSEIALDKYKFDYVIRAESGLDNLEIATNKFIDWMEDCQ